jgi:hypothetical protein
MARRGLVVWLSCLVTGCPSDPAPRDECQDEPDFLLSIQSESGPLPGDLRLHVEYGGGNETYTLAPGSKPEVVFCERVTSTAGEGGATAAPGRGSAGEAGASDPSGHPGLLACRLWTEGPASVELSATGYVTIERDLRIDAEQCTTNVELDLISKPGSGP